jgi:small subunit ribosomal protein S20
LANHKSAEKRARQSLKRRTRNRAVKSEVRSVVKTLRASIDKGDSQAAGPQLKAAESALRRAATKGVIPSRTASRSVARLAKAVQGL